MARCHLFLNDDDFYQLRRITLCDLLDNQSGVVLTSRIVCQAKKELLGELKPEFAVTRRKINRKKKRAEFEADEDEMMASNSRAIVEEFD